MRVCIEVARNAPLFFDNVEGRAANYRMVGPDDAGRLWTVLVRIREDGSIRPINCWPTKAAEVKRYEEAKARQN